MLKLTQAALLLTFISVKAFAADTFIVAEAHDMSGAPPAPVENAMINSVDDESTAVVTAEPTEPTDSNLVEFNIIDNGTISGAKQDEAMLHVFHDQASWEAFWKRHMTVVPAPAAPVVDFEDQQVLAIIDSDQPNSGYYISLERIEKQNNELWVYATREQPGPGCMSLGMVAQPYVIVTINKSDLPAKLLLSTRTYDC